MEYPTSSIGTYCLGKILGQGGMGKVYLAHHCQTGAQVAIKTLRFENWYANDKVMQRFKREGEALRQLNHPNIVKILEVIETKDQYGIVLEYVQGGSLRNLLDTQPHLPLAQILQLAIELADALTRAHHLKIVHRDIKPANILLTASGSPKLTDFGLVRMLEADQVLTQSGFLIGSIAYMSPEVFNNISPDTRLDIWSFGVVLYEMLAGRRPFLGDNPTSTISAILTQTVPDIRQFRPDVSDDLVLLLGKMLEKDPAKRISSIRLVGAELEQILAKVMTPLPITKTNFASRFAKTDSESPSGITRQLPTDSTPFIKNSSLRMLHLKGLSASPQRLVVGVIALLFVLGLGSWFFGVWRSAETSSLPEFILVEPLANPIDERMVLVAHLEPLETPSATIDRFLLADLHEKIEVGSPDTRLVVREYPQIITSAAEAEQVAQANDASIILWGEYTDNNTEINIQVNPTRMQPFSVEQLHEVANIRVRLNNDEMASVVPQVFVARMLLADYEGSPLMSLITLIYLEQLLPAPTAEILGVGAAANVYRYFIDVYDLNENNLELLDNALQIKSSNPLLYYERGMGAVGGFGAYTEGVQDMEAAVRLSNSQWASPYLVLSQLTYELGQPDLAKTYTLNAIELIPNDWLGYYLLGTLYYMESDTSKAKIAFETSIRVAPTATPAYGFLALIALQEGDFERLQHYLKTAFEMFQINPTTIRQSEDFFLDHVTTLRLWTGWFSAFSNLMLGQYASAKGDFEGLLQVVDEPPVGVYMMYGVAACGNQDFDQAVELYQKALALEPEMMILHLLLADSYRKQGDMTAALQAFQAAQANPDWENFNTTVSAGEGEVDELGCQSIFSIQN